MNFPLTRSDWEQIKATALVGSGISRLTRRRSAQEASILNFHGLCHGKDDDRVMDHSLHLSVEKFRRVCSYLASNYPVISMQQLVAALQTGDGLKPNSVVLHFDDGYASNYELAFPILQEFRLPATIFVTTGFLDGTERLWFHRLDLAFGSTQKPFLDWDFEHGRERLPLLKRAQRQAALARVLLEFKHMPEEVFRSEVDRVERTLGITPLSADDIPLPMRPLTWDQAREMQDSGLIEIGAHTHTHPILSRCSAESLLAEITTCRDRITQELGTAPSAFAIPNGSAEDYTTECLTLLESAGFTSACTMNNSRVTLKSPRLELPRYGTPESVWEAEATVSGAFEAVKAWRRGSVSSTFK